ncbi:MscS mechanosensitive ion channel [Thermostichus vulcanus NIES-2134]|nr:MscS mechanosensitive ion channel [Thermostichus vulcanus NIES-2134]
MSDYSPQLLTAQQHGINDAVAIREMGQPSIVQTTITLGYDAPWRHVYKVVIEAGHRTANILTILPTLSCNLP